MPLEHNNYTSTTGNIFKKTQQNTLSTQCDRCSLTPLPERYCSKHPTGVRTILLVCVHLHFLLAMQPVCTQNLVGLSASIVTKCSKQKCQVRVCVSKLCHGDTKLDISTFLQHSFFEHVFNLYFMYNADEMN